LQRIFACRLDADLADVGDLALVVVVGVLDIDEECGNLA
jgi:hypothetical protein